MIPKPALLFMKKPKLASKIMRIRCLVALVGMRQELRTMEASISYNTMRATKE